MVGVGLTVGLAVGGWFASSIIGKFINAGKDQISWSKYMKIKLKKLGESRTLIESLVSAAEDGKVELSPGLQSWLWQLRDAVEAAGGVLDEIEYRRRIRDEVTNEEKVSSAKRKVFSFSRRVVKADPVMQSGARSS